MTDPLDEALDVIRRHAEVCSRYGESQRLRDAADRIEAQGARLEDELRRMGVAREKLRQRMADNIKRTEAELAERIRYLEGQLQDALHPPERRVWVDGAEVDFLVIYREWQRYQEQAAVWAERALLAGVVTEGPDHDDASFQSGYALGIKHGREEHLKTACRCDDLGTLMCPIHNTTALGEPEGKDR